MNPHSIDWNPDAAVLTARAAGLRTLGQQHWLAITTCRELALREGQLPTLDAIVAASGLSAERLRSLFGPIENLLPAIAGLTGRLPDKPA